MLYPYYAPLHGPDYDQARIASELDAHVSPENSQLLVPPFVNGRSIHDPDKLLNIASDEELQNTDYSVLVDGKRQVKRGKNGSFHLYNCTYIPEEPTSKVGYMFNPEDPKKTLFNYVYKKNWTWQDTFSKSYLRETVESFDWQYLQLVRLIVMWPPSIGQTHFDSSPRWSRDYYNEGHATITLNVTNGGGKLYYKDHNNNERICDNNEKIWHFDDSTIHGISPITEATRYQIRLFGKLKKPYRELFK
jgi:hypothetical protein